MIVFDKSNRKSFENVNNWYREVENKLNRNETVVYLVTNKSDLIN